MVDCEGMPVIGKVHSVESMGAVDGPGLRCVVFLQGCPMRCRYCHNPDMWDPGLGHEMDSAEVVRRVLRLRPYFRSTGGLTLSGGEPLMQAPFALEILRGCKQAGIHTALDTCGFYLDAAVEECLRHTDLVLLDVKHSDPDRHKALTGHHMDRVLRFIEYLKQTGTAVWVRHVVVPGWTDREENLRVLLEMVADLPGLQRVELLPYHSMARDKWEALGVPYPLGEVEPPEDELMARLRAVVAATIPARG